MAPASTTAGPTAKSQVASQTRKLEEVTSLMKKLSIDLDEKNLSTSQRESALQKLKVHGRVVQNADPIFTKEGIATLARHGFDSTSMSTSREALRCLANALLLKSPTRQMLVDLGYADKAAMRLKNDNIDDEFLISRILFLMTYDTDVDFARLDSECQLTEAINQCIARHAKRYSKGLRRGSATIPMEDMALSETLKLNFNITHFYPDLAGAFSKSIPLLFKILFRTKIPNPSLQPPVNYLINALLNLDIEGKKSSFGSNPVFPKFDSKANAEHIINILDRAISQYKEQELDTVASPAVALTRRVYEVAPEGVKKYMQWLLLPTDNERSAPVGTSDTLSARLLRLSTSPIAPNIRNSISALMFELSGKDATNFVRNVGYGFAAGFLMSNNIQVPETATDAWSTPGNSQGDNKENAINPITGQRLDAEPQDTGPDMTEEEKEREAERLFVLFERLSNTGVVNVKNPVQQAVDEGRFEELDE